MRVNDIVAKLYHNGLPEIIMMDDAANLYLPINEKAFSDPYSPDAEYVKMDITNEYLFEILGNSKIEYRNGLKYHWGDNLHDG